MRKNAAAAVKQAFDKAALLDELISRMDERAPANSLDDGPLVFAGADMGYLPKHISRLKAKWETPK